MPAQAVMIAGAQSLPGIQAQTGLPIGPAPTFRQGFGRVQLAQALPLQACPPAAAAAILCERRARCISTRGATFWQGSGRVQVAQGQATLPGHEWAPGCFVLHWCAPHTRADTTAGLSPARWARNLGGLAECWLMCTCVASPA